MDSLARTFQRRLRGCRGSRRSRSSARPPPTAAADLAADYRTPQVGVETRFAAPGFAATEKVYRGGVIGPHFWLRRTLI